MRKAARGKIQIIECEWREWDISGEQKKSKDINQKSKVVMKHIRVLRYIR